MAIVTGTEKVFVRRGPGNEFPPFASIPSGSTVEVQDTLGDWTRISTASGQVGYVATQFLSFPGEPEHRPTAIRATPTRLAPTRLAVRTPTPRPTFTITLVPTTTPLRLPTFTVARPVSPTATAIWLSLPSATPIRSASIRPTETQPRPTATAPLPTNTRPHPSETPTRAPKTATPTRFVPSATERPSVTPTRERVFNDPAAAKRIKELEAQLETQREELALWKHRSESMPTATPTSVLATPVVTPDVARELARMASSLEALDKRLGTGAPGAAMDAEPTPVRAKTDEGPFSPFGILLLFVGALFGGSMGRSYERRLERSRRSRLRF